MEASPSKAPRVRRVYARLPSFNPYVGTFHHAPSAGNRGAVYFSGDIVTMAEIDAGRKYRNHPLTGTFHALPGYYDPLHKLAECRSKDEGLLVYSDEEDAVRSVVAVDLADSDDMTDVSIIGAPTNISRMHSDSKFASGSSMALRPRRYSDADAEDFFSIAEQAKASAPNAPKRQQSDAAAISAHPTPRRKSTSAMRMRIRSRSSQIASSANSNRARLLGRRRKSTVDSSSSMQSSDSDTGSLAESSSDGHLSSSFDPGLDNGFISTGKGIFRMVYYRTSGREQHYKPISSTSSTKPSSSWGDDTPEDEYDGEYNQVASRTPLNPFVARRLTDGDELRVMPVYRDGAKRESIRLNSESESEDDSAHPKPFFIHESAVTDQYELVGADQLGDGSYAVVKPAIRRSDGKEVAIKQIHKRYLMTEFAKNAVAREIEIHLRLKHRHIVRLYEVYETQDFLYLVMAKATGGNLKQLMLRHRQLSEPLAAKIVKQIVRAVFYLHESGVVHCDLKPENILLTDPKDSSDGSSPKLKRNRSMNSMKAADPHADTKASDFQVALCDFGLAVKVPDVRFFKLTGDVHKVPFTSLTGTPGYIAPELFQEKSYGKPADMWSIGIITYEMLTGYQPFYPPAACVDDEADYNEYIWKNISVQAKDLVMHLLEKDPAKRFTAAEALAHAWFEHAAFAL